jgi:hypothetical protein
MVEARLSELVFLGLSGSGTDSAGDTLLIVVTGASFEGMVLLQPAPVIDRPEAQERELVKLLKRAIALLSLRLDT